MDREQQALNKFEKKYNCSQSVLSVFADELGIDDKTALKTASCFGGGMKCGEVCGAITGALMALGLKYGGTAEYDIQNKQAMRMKTLGFIKEFKDRNGAILCRELLNDDSGDNAVCKKAIKDAVQILEKIFSEA